MDSAFLYRSDLPREFIERTSPIPLTEKWEVKNETPLPFISYLPSFCMQTHPRQRRVIQNECVHPIRAVPLRPDISTSHKTPLRYCG